ncbi:MAG: hypothetical protein ACRCV5_09925 [Afipia sp.]
MSRLPASGANEPYATSRGASIHAEAKLIGHLPRLQFRKWIGVVA